VAQRRKLPTRRAGYLSQRNPLHPARLSAANLGSASTFEGFLRKYARSFWRQLVTTVLKRFFDCGRTQFGRFQLAFGIATSRLVMTNDFQIVIIASLAARLYNAKRPPVYIEHLCNM
jgi:hypothetical protein